VTKTLLPCPAKLSPWRGDMVLVLPEETEEQ